MSIFRTLAALGSAVCAIMVAYFAGHGISEGHAGPYIAAGVALVACIVLVAGQVAIGRGHGSDH